MASINAHFGESPTLREKIRLFEGRSTSAVDLRTSSPLRQPMSFSPLLGRSVAEKEKSTLGDSSWRSRASVEFPHTLPLTATHTERTRHLSESTDLPPPPTTPKWNVITVEGEYKSRASGVAAKEKGKGKEKEKEMFALALDPQPTESEVLSPRSRMPMLAKSPRRPSIERKYEEEVIKLKRMTTEEKQMVKALIKHTNKKNKMLDILETSIQQERESLISQVEEEKTALSAKLQILDSDLANKSRELSAETMRSNDFAEKIIKLERERQEIRLALAASKRESRQCRQNCDAELNKKTQSLMDMATQLNSLTCLRHSMNCVICEEKVAMTVLLPCRHMVLCASCSHKVVKCPMCRVDIRSKLEVFTNWDV